MLVTGNVLVRISTYKFKSGMALHYGLFYEVDEVSDKKSETIWHLCSQSLQKYISRKSFVSLF